MEFTTFDDLKNILSQEGGGAQSMAKPSALGTGKRGIIGSDIKFSARTSVAQNRNQH